METVLFRQRRVLALVIGLILVAGLSSLVTIARQEDPTITNLFATIVTPFPGATAERVEALVTERLEDELREVEEIDTIESTSRNGLSLVTVELLETLTDKRIEETWSEIRDALADAEAEFPAGAGSPSFDNDRTNAFTAIGALVWRSDAPVNLAVLGRFGEELQDRLRNVPNTKVVRLYGAPTEEVIVEIDPDVAASLGLTADDIAAALARADTKVAAGQLRAEGTDLLIEVSGELDSLARIREVPLLQQASGALLRVGDVATVRRGTNEPASDLAFVDGEPAVVVAARMEADRRVDQWKAAVDAVLAAYEAELPAGIEHRLIFDQSVYTTQRLGTLMTNLLIGVGLVVTVLFVTLGWRSALVVTAALPLTSLISLFTLKALGVPIHQMSVTGLIVALGLLVDAAIVMTDDIRTRLERGQTPLDAVAGGVRRLWLPLLSSTVTTVLAFMPMVLLPGPAGDFVGAIAISVIVALTASFLLAITVTPALAGLALAPVAGRERRRRSIGLPNVGKVFAASLKLSLRHPRLSMMAAGVLPLLGFVAFPTLTEQFFPASDRNQFYVQMWLPSQTSIDETAETALSAYDLLTGYEEIEDVHWFVGNSAPAFYYNMQMNQDGVASFAEALVTLRSAEDAARLMPEVQDRLDARFPQAQTIVREILQGPPVAAPVELRIYGPDVDRLRVLGDEVRRILATVPDVTHTRASLTGGEPKLWFVADEDAARQAGLQLADIARQLEAALEGSVGGSILEGTEELPVRVRVGGDERGALDRIASLKIVPPGADGAEAFPAIPLTALGELTLIPAAAAIPHRNGERVNVVQGFIDAGVLPQTALAAFQARLDETGLTLPSGYRLEVGGDAEGRGDVITNLIASVGLIVTLTVATIVLTFNSFRLAGIVAVVSFQAIGLGLFSLAVFGYPFGIQAVIGLIGSVGVSINAAIIIMSALQKDAVAVTGDPARTHQIVGDASRHIISTTVTTFGGFLPLILAGGGFWPPFAMAIAGGVLLSTVVSFYFVPPAFMLVTRGRPVAKPAEQPVAEPMPLPPQAVAA